MFYEKKNIKNERNMFFGMKTFFEKKYFRETIFERKRA